MKPPSRKMKDIDDDDLISIATTCSNRSIALAAEVALRKKHPSRVASGKLKGAQTTEAAAKAEREMGDGKDRLFWSKS